MSLGVEDAQDFIIFKEAMEVEIGNDHLPRAETPTMNDVVRFQVDKAGFRTGYYEAGVIERETAGAQPVAVEDGSYLVAISEREGCGTIPRLDAVAAVLQKTKMSSRGWPAAQSCARLHRRCVRCGRGVRQSRRAMVESDPPCVSTG